MSAQRRIAILKELGVTITPEIRHREEAIDSDYLNRVQEKYGVNWEEDADKVRDAIESARIAEWVGDSPNFTRIAPDVSESVRYEKVEATNFFAQVDKLASLGTRNIISGGEVLELGEQHGDDNIPF